MPSRCEIHSENMKSDAVTVYFQTSCEAVMQKQFLFLQAKIHKYIKRKSDQFDCTMARLDVGPNATDCEEVWSELQLMGKTSFTTGCDRLRKGMCLLHGYYRTLFFFFFPFSSGLQASRCYVSVH